MDNPQETPFLHRGWGIRVLSDPDRFEEAVGRALREAPTFGITTLDLHDGAIPPGVGWVDLFARYRQVQGLRDHDMLTYHGRQVTNEERAMYQRRFRDLCRTIKERGLRIHVWHHVLRDLPEEWLAIEPTLSRLEGRRLWQVLGGMLDDFLDAVPEVDAVTVTAREILAATVREATGPLSGDRLRAIYQCIYESCRRHRRQLIVREVGSTQAERDAFIHAIGPLPPDILIMAKDVQGDWYHLEAPLNPLLYRLSGKNIILEADLYGEHWGHLEVPLCRLRKIHCLVRSWLSLPIVGAIGRIMVQEGADEPMIHVFDTPNAANVAAFCHLLQDPSPHQPPGDPNLDAFDMHVWMDWLHAQYGANASPHVIAALDRTVQICRLTFYLGGAYFQHRSFLPSPDVFEREMWPTFANQADRLGLDLLRWEKEEALRLVRQSLRDIELARQSLAPADYDMLLGSFEQNRDIILAYRALIGLCIAGLEPSQMPSAVHEALDLAERLETVRGSTFFGHLSERLRQLAQYMQDVGDGAPPKRVVSPVATAGETAEGEGTADVADLGIPRE